MSTIKEFCIIPRCSATELAGKVNSGWQIQLAEFMPDGTLHVLLFRDVVAASPAPAAAEAVTVTHMPPRPIVSTPLPANVTIMGLGTPRSVPLTHNKPERGATRPVSVPTGDAVRSDIGKRYSEAVEAILNSKPRPFGQPIQD